MIQTCASKSLRRTVLPALAALTFLAGCSVSVTHPATPTANFGGAFTAVAGTQQTFNASTSMDRQSEPLTYAWNFGDGRTATGVSPTHTYAMVGPVVVSLTVTDASTMSSVVTAKGVVAAGTPVANAGGPYVGTVGIPISISSGGSTDPQGEALTYAWNFGDGGSTPTGISPSHIYARPGTYVVSVNVTNTSNLNAMATTKTTIVAAAPTASAGGPYAGTVGTLVSFDGGSSTDPQGETLTYAWSFGDGTMGVGSGPRHTYAMPGAYVASATVTNSSNLDASAAAKVTVVAAAPVAKPGGPYASTVGTSVNLSGGGSTDPQGEALTYSWSFGDGGATGAGINPSHAYAMPGTYIVSLTVTNTNNLSATTTTNATVSAASPYADPGGPYTSIAGKSITLGGSKSTDPQGETLTYVWSFGDGSTNGTGMSSSHAYATRGTYIVSLTVTNTSNLSATTTTNLTISPAPPYANPGGPYTSSAGTAVRLSAGGSTDPQGETLTFAWSFGDGSTNGTGVSPSHTYAMPGTYFVSLTVTNTSNLSATTTTNATISAAPPCANAGGPYTSMAGKPISLSGGGSTDPEGKTLAYVWSFGDGSANGTGVSPSHTYAVPGIYIVSLTVTDTSNLSATTTGNATISAVPPYANAAGPYASMAGRPITLDGSGSTDPQGQTLTFGWSFGDGSTNGEGVSPSHTYAAAGTYSVSLTVTNAANMTATATALATIAGAPPSPNRVMAGLHPISNSSVQLYAVGTVAAPASVPLLPAPLITDLDGGFSIAGLYTCPSPATQVYLVATGGNPGLTTGTNNSSINLMAALGSCSNLWASPGPITIDEVSTIEAVWPSAAYLSSNSLVGGADPRNLSNAFIDSANLASILSGSPAYPGTVLAGQDLAIRSLANSLASCVDSEGDTYPGSPCGRLFAAATPVGGNAPADTVSAARGIALNPSLNVSLLYYLAASQTPFEPALSSPPTDWTVGLPHPALTSFSSSLNSSTVFMGDSITDFWRPWPVHNAGISGQHASEMLARFPTDVLGHGYARVVILAGTNDLWHPTVQSDQALQQIEAMAAMGKSAKIEVVLCMLTPMTFDPVYWRPVQASFNAALADFAMTNGYLLVDYYTPMVGHPEYFNDGVHPNGNGYAVMESALSSVILQ